MGLVRFNIHASNLPFQTGSNEMVEELDIWLSTDCDVHNKYAFYRLDDENLIKAFDRKAWFWLQNEYTK